MPRLQVGGMVGVKHYKSLYIMVVKKLMRDENLRKTGPLQHALLSGSGQTCGPGGIAIIIIIAIPDPGSEILGQSLVYERFDTSFHPAPPVIAMEHRWIA